MNECNYRKSKTENVPQHVALVESEGWTPVVLNSELIENLLNQKKEYKDYYVSVVSIVGEPKTGKSFLMNCFIRYLQTKYVKVSVGKDWLNPALGPLTGFSVGSEGDLNGIYMWPELFCTQNTTEKIAIILLDVKNHIHNESVLKVSTLISSVQIVNVVNNIDVDYLQKLQALEEFVQEDSSLCKSLLFLVRDWGNLSNESTEFGIEGGSNYLADLLTHENAEIRKNFQKINDIYEQKSCFLMPKPGAAVEQTKNYKIEVKDLNNHFKACFGELARIIFHPDNLVVKEINGKRLKVEELAHHFKEYCGRNKLIKSDNSRSMDLQHYIDVSEKAFERFKNRLEYPFYDPSRVQVFIIVNETFYALASKDNQKLLGEYFEITIKKCEEYLNKRAREEYFASGPQRINRAQSKPSTSRPAGDQDQLSPGNIAVAVGLVGAVAAAAYGVFRAFSASDNSKK